MPVAEGPGLPPAGPHCFCWEPGSSEPGLGRVTTTGVPSPHPIPEAFPTAGKMDGLPRPSSKLKLGTQLLFPGIRSLLVKGHKNVPETDMG